MTDRQMLEELFRKRGISFTYTTEGLTIEAGYIGFYSVFRFNAEGELTAVEAYE